MKAIILAGGLGTRLSEETAARPKPMVEIGGKPILWHIMKIYEAAGITEFIICGGYKSYMIKEFFANYSLHNSDITFDFSTGITQVHNQNISPWKVTVIDTGATTLTGGRLLRAGNLINDENFCMTYGDGVANLDIRDQIQFHESHQRMVTVTGVRTPGRFGFLEIEEDRVTKFSEKPDYDSTWINGGFFVINRKALQKIEGDNISWENEPLQQLAHEDQVRVWKHEGFWQPMDTLREKHALETLWESGNPPWKIWNNQ